jgi:hypothetical protein
MRRVLGFFIAWMALIYIFLLLPAAYAVVLDDSYSESNYTDGIAVTSAYNPEVGQSFTSSGGTLNSVRLYLNKTGSPTGSAYAKIYAHSGTYGTSSVPTGAALATSDALNVATLTGSPVLTTLTFSGANKITLSPATYYVVTLSFTGGDGSNYPSAGFDDSSPSHSGNAALYDGSWSGADTVDVIFYVYKDDPATTGQVIMISKRDAR